MMDPLAEPSTTYRSLKRGVIREGADTQSAKVGNLAEGEVFEVLVRCEEEFADVELHENTSEFGGSAVGYAFHKLNHW